MITLLPSLAETLVVPLDATQVTTRLTKAIESKIFIGKVKGNRFSLTAHMFKPPQFRPIVLGEISSSPRGSLIFVRYELVRSMKFSLIFWSLVVMGGSIGAAYSEKNFLFTGIGVLMILVIRWIVLSNMRLHKEPARKALLDALS